MAFFLLLLRGLKPLPKVRYRIGIEYSDLHSISIVLVSKKVVLKTSGTVNKWIIFQCF